MIEVRLIKLLNLICFQLQDTDHFRKSDFVLSHDSMQLTLDSSIDNDASRLNSIVYSTINNDTTLAEQQFTK